MYCCMMAQSVLWVEYFLRHIRWECVDEKCKESNKEKDDEDLENKPAIVEPEDITECLQRI